MLENPYCELLSIIKGVSVNNNNPGIEIGQIVSPPPEIEIAYKGIILYKKDLWINDYLLTEHSRTSKGHIVSETQPAAGGSGEASFSSHTHAIDNDYTESYITTDTDLKIGYYVALMPVVSSVDNTTQQYIVLCHIRRLV